MLAYAGGVCSVEQVFAPTQRGDQRTRSPGANCPCPWHSHGGPLGAIRWLFSPMAKRFCCCLTRIWTNPLLPIAHIDSSTTR